MVFQQSQLGFVALRGINLFHQSGGLLILGRNFSDNVHQRIKRVHACCLPFVHAGGEIETFFAVDGNFFGFGYNILTVDFCQQVDQVVAGFIGIARGHKRQLVGIKQAGKIIQRRAHTGVFHCSQLLRQPARHVFQFKTAVRARLQRTVKQRRNIRLFKPRLQRLGYDVGDIVSFRIGGGGGFHNGRQQFFHCFIAHCSAGHHCIHGFQSGITRRSADIGGIHDRFLDFRHTCALLGHALACIHGIGGMTQ